MRHMISRPARGLLPLALAVTALFMPGAGEKALSLTAAVMLARLLSLCSGAAFRIAAGSVVNDARLRGNFISAMLAALVAGALSAALCWFDIPYISAIGLQFALAGAFINIAQLCCDRLYAAFDSFSPPLFDLIIAALAAAGLMISNGSDWLLPAFALPAAITGGILVFGLRSGSRVRPGFSTLRYAPIAVLNSGLFHGIIAGFALWRGATPCELPLLLAALAIMDIFESPFRRNSGESGYTAIAIAICAIAAALCGRFVDTAPEYSMCSVVFGCAGILFSCFGVLATGVNLSIHHCIMLVCILALGVFTVRPCGTAGLIATIGLCLTLISLCFPDITAIRRASRARHLQRRRAR